MSQEFDVIVIGAGVSGLYTLYKLRELGLSARVFEAGTGIGLSIVDQIVTTHGGRMEVTSSPGVGSCFTMVIPATVLAG